jgi:GH35 family endo-1,4-beta-xylanase
MALMRKFSTVFLVVGALTIAATAVGPEGSVNWGINFSQSQAEYLGLDWKKTYLAIIDDLGAKNLKLITNWNWIEGKREDFYFRDTDWQIQEAEKKGVKLIYVLGMKTGRWPECHIPDWAAKLSREEQQRELLQYLTEVVLRYRKSEAIAYWQVENEPFFKFGKCPSWYYRSDELLRSEVSLVKALDRSRRIIVSDSGERSNWQHAAEIGDIVGTTMYRTNVRNAFGSRSYSFLDPEFYSQKVETIKSLYGKDVICIELQAEPWPSKPLMEAPLAEQLQSMNPDMFRENVDYAPLTGLKAFYFWGAEWWYWMKEKHGQPEIWDEAKQLFRG